MTGQPLASKLLHQAILMGTVVSFHSSFGLGRTGSDDLDSQALAHPAKLRPRYLPSQTLSFRRLPLVDILAIGVQRLRHPILVDPGSQHSHRCPDRLLPSQSAQDGTAGIIHHVHETALGASSFPPSMEAAVQLHQFAKVRLARSSLAKSLAFSVPRP